MKQIFRSMFTIVLALVFLSGLSYSQSTTTSAFEGKVTDETGLALPGVEVTVSSPDTIGGARSTITDVEGKYRFPALQPGTYSIEASLQGFTSQRREAIRLFVGVTLTADFALTIGTLEEEVTVIAVAPLIDVKDSSVGTAHISEATIRDVIFARDSYQYAAMDLAPGVYQAGWHGSAAYGGAARSGNAYTMDGAEFSMVTNGTSWMESDNDIFSEAKVMGLGAPAEYDGFQGLHMSLITKSGGNNLDGMLQFIYEDYGWVSESVPDDPLYSLITVPPKENYIDAHFQIGGPIKKDKLWFFVSGTYVNHGYEETSVDATAARYYKLVPTGIAKLSFQPTQSTRLSLFFVMDYFIMEHQYQSIYVPYEAAEYEREPSTLTNLSMLHTFSDTTFWESKVAITTAMATGGGYGTGSGRFDALTGMYSVNASGWSKSYSHRYQLINTLSHHAEDFIVGSHDFKFGVEFDFIGSQSENGPNGGYFYEDNVYSWADHQLHNYAYTWGRYRKPRGIRGSFFVQDAWNVTSNFTINPGIRFVSWKGWLETSDEKFSTSAWAPRIGFSWDIFGDHKTALKGHYGRFTDKLTTGRFRGATQAEEDDVTYEVMADGTFVEVDRTYYSNPTTIASDIRMPFMDQFTLGIEREIMKDTSVSASIVYKKWHNSISKINIGRRYELIEFDFQDENDVTQTWDVWGRISSSIHEDQFVIDNASPGITPTAIRRSKASYYGFVAEINKRFSKNWMLNSSYSYGKRTSWPTGTSPNGLLELERYGGEPITYPFHIFKVYGTFIAPWNLTISPSINWRTAMGQGTTSTGRWQRRIRAPVRGNPYVAVEKPGTNKMPNFFDVSVRVEKRFTIKGDMQIAAYIDIYNLTGRSRAVGMESRIDRANFGKATEINVGREFRLAIRLYF